MSMIIKNTTSRWLPVMVTNTGGTLVPRHIEPYGQLSVSAEDAERIKANYGGSVEVNQVPVELLPLRGRL